VKDRALAAMENQDYPFEELVENVLVNRDASRNPLFDSQFIMGIDTGSDGSPSKGILTSGTAPGNGLADEFRNKTAKFDLTLSASEALDKLSFSLQYCTKLFKKQTIQRFITYFKNIVSHILDQPTIKLSGIEILSPAEKKQLLYNFNDTAKPYPRDRTIHRLFTEQSAKTPDAVAVEGRGWHPQPINAHAGPGGAPIKWNRSTAGGNGGLL
ncbi:MAG: hypothetical protein GY940_32880, partial [bacterium]|nr:hypothetical protein [bacterium]